MPMKPKNKKTPRRAARATRPTGRLHLAAQPRAAVAVAIEREPREIFTI